MSSISMPVAVVAAAQKVPQIAPELRKSPSMGLGFRV